VEIDVPVSTIDIMPTILDWAGAALPPGLDAVSLRPALQGQWPAEARSLFSELDAVTDPNHWAYYFGVRFNMRSVQQGQWKLIHHVGNQAADELYLLGDSSLYETTNLITQEAERARKMLEELERIYKP
jgi:arylsulfatase A-like enzyme